MASDQILQDEENDDDDDDDNFPFEAEFTVNSTELTKKKWSR
jgi:hypothetical protein